MTSWEYWQNSSRSCLSSSGCISAMVSGGRESRSVREALILRHGSGWWRRFGGAGTWSLMVLWLLCEIMGRDKQCGQCDYGGCDESAAGGYHVHGDDHQFCEYHLDEVSP